MYVFSPPEIGGQIPKSYVRWGNQKNNKSLLKSLYYVNTSCSTYFSNNFHRLGMSQTRIGINLGPLILDSKHSFYRIWFGMDLQLNQKQFLHIWITLISYLLHLHKTTLFIYTISSYFVFMKSKDFRKNDCLVTSSGWLLSTCKTRMMFWL